MLLFLAIFLPLGCAPLLAFGGRLGRRLGWLALAAPVFSFGALLVTAAGREPFTSRIIAVDWIPTLDVQLSLMLDGLSLFYGLVVSGMGILVTFYSIHYLHEPGRRLASFYAYLMFFMGSMLGTVFAENLLVLVVFWELTGVASFLLIGFTHGEQEARGAARTALIVTAGAGLVMLAGIALLGRTAGTLSLARLLADGWPADARDALGAAFLLIAVGAFGKSAQFPFHFWLPQAMVAPTPVSAYLHAATMVKLGVFLVARFYPLMHGLEAWGPVLIAVGFFTMLFAAVLAFLSHDLKAILAYATVSQLGLFIGAYALEKDGVKHDLAHITDHVFYKGCLFMVAGVVDHAAGTRDVRRLGGLAYRAPLLGAIALVAAATFAGLPGTLGWPSLLSSFSETYAYAAHGEFWPVVPLVFVGAATALKLAIAGRIAWSVFLRPAEPRAEFHPPGVGILLPPAVLAAGCVLFGFWPAGLSQLLEPLHVPGLHAATSEPLRAWTGLNRECLTALAALAAGGALFGRVRAARWERLRLPRWLQLDAGFERALVAARTFARALTRSLGTDRPSVYLPVAVLFLVATLGSWLALNADQVGLGWERLSSLGPPSALRSLVVVLVAGVLALVVGLRRWSGQLIALSIVGFLLTFYYVLFRAPDLAMTQILIDSVTLILVLLLLVRFSHAAETGERRDRPPLARRCFDVALSTALGLTMTAAIYAMAAHRPANPAGDFYLQNSAELAHGKNAVNTILVDFRGMDTLFEITVILLATLGALGLFMRYRRDRDEHAAGPGAPPGLSVKAVRKEEGP